MYIKITNKGGSEYDSNGIQLAAGEEIWANEDILVNWKVNSGKIVYMDASSTHHHPFANGGHGRVLAYDPGTQDILVEFIEVVHRHTQPTEFITVFTN